jgi:hypothetical protein
MDDFEDAARLAGYFVAHGMWSLSDGATVSPMIAHEGPGGRGFQKFLGDSDTAEEYLEANPSGADRAVMIVDGYFEVEGVRRDALIARVVAYGPPRQSLHIVVPYRPARSDAGFAVHSPRFGNPENIDPVRLDALGDAFFSGVVLHTAASPIWTSHLDESV